MSFWHCLRNKLSLLFFIIKMRRLLILFIISIVVCGCCEADRKLKVAIQPYGDFEQALVDTIRRTLEKNYNIETQVLKYTSVPKETFVNIKSPRFRADKIIAILKKQKPDSLDFILGLTVEDISMTKKEAGRIKEPVSKYEDWGVFGLGYMPGESCIISSFRLKDKGQKIFVQRLKKVANHELGHNMGLEHCESEKCVMRDAAESIKTIDFVGLKLCDRCKQRI